MSEQPEWTTLAWWKPREGQVFSLSTTDASEPQPVSPELRLREASGTHEQARPFRLLFVAAPGLSLPQSIYRLHPADAEALDIFLVPLQPDAEGAKFEAIFN